MLTDPPHAYFEYHLMAVLQCHVVLCSSATISQNLVKCDIWMIHFTNGWILSTGGVFPPCCHLSVLLYLFEEVLHEPNYFLVFTLCCGILFGVVAMTTSTATKQHTLNFWDFLFVWAEAKLQRIFFTRLHDECNTSVMLYNNSNATIQILELRITCGPVSYIKGHFPG